MRAFNLIVFLVLVVAVVIVAWVALGGGRVALGGYPGPVQPQQVQISPISLP